MKPTLEMLEKAADLAEIEYCAAAAEETRARTRRRDAGEILVSARKAYLLAKLGEKERPCVRPDHLFLGTGADNARDAVSKGRDAPHVRPDRISRGERRPNTKLKSSDIPRIRHLVNVGVPLRDVARAFGVVRSTIRDVILGRSWTHVS